MKYCDIILCNLLHETLNRKNVTIFSEMKSMLLLIVVDSVTINFINFILAKINNLSLFYMAHFLALIILYN